MKHLPTFKNFLNEQEEILNEDNSLALFLILQAAVINGMLIGQMAAGSGGDGFHPIDDLKAWWAKRKKDKAVQSIIDKLKGDPDVIAFMNLKDSAQRGKWYKLIAPKLNDEEQKYLNSITRTPFMKESVNENFLNENTNITNLSDDMILAMIDTFNVYHKNAKGNVTDKDMEFIKDLMKEKQKRKL